MSIHPDLCFPHPLYLYLPSPSASVIEVSTAMPRSSSSFWQLSLSSQGSPAQVQCTVHSSQGWASLNCYIRLCVWAVVGLCVWAVVGLCVWAVVGLCVWAMVGLCENVVSPQGSWMNTLGSVRVSRGVSSSLLTPPTSHLQPRSECYL